MLSHATLSKDAFMIPILLIRFLPWLNGVLGFLVAKGQWQWTDLYPWPLVMHVTLFTISMAIMGWKRMPLWQFLEKMSLPLLAMIATSSAFLVFEDEWVHTLLTSLIAFISFFSLELFFVSQFNPAKYPLNGLSRWNMALIPCIGFLGGAVIQGVQTFLQWPIWIEPLMLSCIGAIAYGVTSHPTATHTLKLKWVVLGALIGGQIGVLGAVIPAPMSTFGAIAAVCLAIPLRVRRYAYAPIPPRSLAWGEGITMLGCLAIILAGTKWV